MSNDPANWYEHYPYLYDKYHRFCETLDPFPKTWNEFFAFGEKAKEEGRDLFTYQGIYPSYVESMLITSIASEGGLDTVNKVFNFEEGAWETEAAKND